MTPINKFAQTCIEAIDQKIEELPYGSGHAALLDVIDIIRAEASKAEEVAMAKLVAQDRWLCRRYCKGDRGWTSWTEVSAAEYERRKDDETFEFKPVEPQPAEPTDDNKIWGALAWMYRRLGNTYGRLKFVEDAMALAIAQSALPEGWTRAEDGKLIPPPGHVAQGLTAEQPKACSGDATPVCCGNLIQGAPGDGLMQPPDPPHCCGQFVEPAEPVAQPVAQEEPSEIESVIACLEDDATYLKQSEPGCEMADNMRVAAKLLQARAMSSADAPTFAERLAAAQQPMAHTIEHANRYLWLRDPNNQRHEDDICVSDTSFNTYYGDELDAAIDAAISAESKL